jgi:hypothetical protein
MNYISLGYFCSVAIELEKLGLRSESSPFDWTLADFKGVIAAIEENFSGFMDYEYLLQSGEYREIYLNSRYNIKFFHDFDMYRPLSVQLPEVRKKYDRRIERFYKSICEPTLFVRYISDIQKVDGKSAELIWIEDNYEKVISLLKSFNKENDILFIANEGVTSDKIVIYNVEKDEGDSVARNPIHKSSQLFSLFSGFDHKDKQANIERYNKKQKKKRSIYNRIKRKTIPLFKKTFCKVYTHEHMY